MFAPKRFFQLLKKQHGIVLRQKHSLSAQESNPSAMVTRKMRGWQIHTYGGVGELQLSENIKIPLISSSDEVLVRVQAAGVNPIDVVMTRGYGAQIFNLARQAVTDIEFPLTFGREFTGTIVQKGLGTSNRLEMGQQVWGVVPLQRPGSHAEYVVVPETTVTELPKELSDAEGSAILYAGLTAWSGLFIFSNFKSQTNTTRPKKVLVLGASGSVGSLAAQILKAEKAIVIGSCSTDAIPIVQTLGLDHIIDYTNQSSVNDFSYCGPYDIILDCAGQGPDSALKYGWQFKEYITFSGPFVRNVDEQGLALGMAKNVSQFVESNVKSLTTKQGCIKWAYFVPCLSGIEYLKGLVERKKLLPRIDATFDFTETSEAYKKVEEGHLRGKVVVEFGK